MARRNRVRGEIDYKISIIGDEDTVVGFLLAGIGSRDGLGRTNFLVVDSKTRRSAIEDKFKELTERKDNAIILINQHIADEIRHLVDLHKKTQPVIIEVPSKDKPWNSNTDILMQRVKLIFGGQLPE